MKTLKELRAERDWTQKDLAIHAGVSFSAVWSAEKGRAMRKSTFLKICQACCVPTWEVDALVREKTGRFGPWQTVQFLQEG